MFRRYDQSQPFLLPPSLQDFVEKGHPAYVINDLRASTCPFLLSGWMAAVATFGLSSTAQGYPIGLICLRFLWPASLIARAPRGT